MGLHTVMHIHIHILKTALREWRVKGNQYQYKDILNLIDNFST